jgi:hypothetical protein
LPLGQRIVMREAVAAAPRAGVQADVVAARRAIECVGILRPHK